MLVKFNANSRNVLFRLMAIHVQLTVPTDETFNKPQSYFFSEIKIAIFIFRSIVVFDKKMEILE